MPYSLKYLFVTLFGEFCESGKWQNWDIKYVYIFIGYLESTAIKCRLKMSEIWRSRNFYAHKNKRFHSFESCVCRKHLFEVWKSVLFSFLCQVIYNHPAHKAPSWLVNVNQFPKYNITLVRISFQLCFTESEFIYFPAHRIKVNIEHWAAKSRLILDSTLK